MITINKTFNEYMHTIYLNGNDNVRMACDLMNNKLSLEEAGEEIKMYDNMFNIPFESTDLDDYVF